ncbi:hypothetical protein F4677DRAFT_8315 [Hypoxylon crocopeplum]|nr:hypothetical protein F4677DRAFT_8315 [Hypoxylon crocopeplum]
MKFTAGPLFATLALTAYLPGILAMDFAASRGSVVPFRRELGNGTAAANGTEAIDDQGNDEEDENLEEELENDGIDIDDDNFEESLEQNIVELMLGLGICDFDFGSLGDIGLNSQVQLLLQLQQLAQLQQLGLVNSFSIEQLIQQELLLNNFNLNIFKRTVSATVKQAARANKRTVMVKRECKNKSD